MTALVKLYTANGTDHLALVNWITKEYGLGRTDATFMNVHRMRREKIATRLRLYRDELEIALGQVIDRIYTTQEMREILRAYIEVSSGMNVSRRIVNEVASLYDRPALRTFPDEATSKRFRAEEKRLSLHFVHQEAHRLTNLCNETLLWQFNGVDDKTALRIVTPNLFDAIPDPRDALVPAGYIIDRIPISMLSNVDSLPHYEIWDDAYRYLINKHGRLVDENGGIATVPIEHGLGRIPGVLFHRREPTTCILDASYGEDIKSSHLAVGLLDVMIMRLSKTQGERQPILQGNLAAMASGQVATGERPLLLPPEVVALMLDTKTDPDHYLLVKRDKITSVAQTYGMSYEQFTFQETADTASGKAYQVRREKLTELRMEQRGRAVKHEEMTVELMGFPPEDLDVDFQEQAIPQDAAEEIDLLDKKMRLGLDSVIAYVMRKDPDKTVEEAKKFVLDNLEYFALLVKSQRALNAPADADAANPGRSPQENGADNAPKSDDAEQAA